MAHSIKEIKKYSEKILNALNWSVKPNTNNPNTAWINNAFAVKDAIDEIESLGLFSDLTNSLKASLLFTTSDPAIKMDIHSANNINSQLITLKTSLTNLVEALSQVVPEESPESINIKLPPVNDFNDLSDVARDLHIALSQVLYLKEIDAPIKIESVENGSIWLNVYLGTPVALAVVGRMVWAGVVIFKAMREGKMVEEQLRAYKVRNDSMEDVRESQKKMLDILVQAEAEHVNSESFKEDYPENIERIKNSIKLFAGLLDKGAEIQPALLASESISDMFPDMKKLPIIESKIKQIAPKGDTSSNS